MKIVVDRKMCREYANSVIEPPDVFDADDDPGKLVELLAQPDAAVHGEVRAATSCPVHAVTLVD